MSLQETIKMLAFLLKRLEMSNEFPEHLATTEDDRKYIRHVLGEIIKGVEIELKRGSERK